MSLGTETAGEAGATDVRGAVGRPAFAGGRGILGIGESMVRAAEDEVAASVASLDGMAAAMGNGNDCVGFTCPDTGGESDVEELVPFPPGRRHPSVPIAIASAAATI